MNELHEETHYQLALTNRQVLTAFVVLLGCLFVAFFAGVWIGRGESSSLAGTNLAATDPTLGSRASDDEEGEGFEFFERTATTPEPLLERSERRSGPAAPPSDTTSPPEIMRGTRIATPVVRRDDRQDRETLGDSEALDGITIQVFSSTEREKADTMLGRIAEAGFQATISPVEIDGRQFYRVRVGPFATRELAEARAEELERDFDVETWIQPARE